MLLDIVSRLLTDIISYANENISGEDILLPKLCINEDVATVRPLINKDGASVSKSPPLSTLPLFLAVQTFLQSKGSRSKILC